jgi:hypothetical protein
MFEPLRHLNVTSSHPGVDLDRKKTVVIFTNLPADPTHSDFDKSAYDSLTLAVQSYLDEHPEYDHAIPSDGRNAQGTARPKTTSRCGWQRGGDTTGGACDPRLS